MRQALEREVLQLRSRLVRAAHSYVFREPRNLLRQYNQTILNTKLRLIASLRSEYVERQQRVDEAQSELVQNIRMATQEKSLQLKRLKAQLRSLNPKAVLQRGYSITRTKDGRVVSRVKNINSGDELNTLLSDGEVISTVKSCKE